MTQKMSSGFVSTFFCSLFALSFLLLFSASGGTVTSSADSGPGTLRQEVADASADDIIDFDAGIDHIALSSGQIVIDKSLTIDGGGNVTINGGGANRIFDLSGSPRTWNILGLFITNGLANGAGNDAFGGGIRMSFDTHANTLVVSNCTIANCSANDFGGGIYIHSGTVSSRVSICDSAIGDNTAGLDGGGVYTAARLDMDYVLLSGNTSSKGGALSSSDDVSTSTWRNVTFLENEATESGGAIYVKHVAADIVDCTFTGNVAGVRGGAIYTAGLGAYHGAPECDIVISNCVFTSNLVTLTYAYNYNGGALLVGGSNGDRDTVAAMNCLFESNRCGNVGAGLYNSGFCSVSNCEFVGNEARRSGGGIHNDAGFLTIDDTSIRDNTTLESGNEGGAGLRTAQFAPDSAWTIVRNSSISGNSSAAGGGGIRNYQQLTMIDCLISNNVNNSGQGGGLWTYSDDTSVTCSLDHVLFTDNRSVDKGGAMYIERAQVFMENSQFSRNAATNMGGAIYVESYGTPHLMIEDTTFFENIAMLDSYYTGGGGAILTRERITVDGCSFVSNSAPVGLGGALALTGSEAEGTVINSTFSGNSASHTGSVQKAGGGALFVGSAARLAAYHSTIHTNTAAERGGGILVRDNSSGSVSLYSCIIAGNSAGDEADDIFSRSSTDLLSLDHCLYGDTNGWNEAWVNANLVGDPLLSALASNGGPTRTHAMAVQSPCINAGITPGRYLYYPVIADRGDAWSVLNLHEIATLGDVTGVSEQNTDAAGTQYLSIADVNGDASAYRLDIYKDSARSQLVGHTATWSVEPGWTNLSITEDNSSGLGGTITVNKDVPRTSEDFPESGDFFSVYYSDYTNITGINAANTDTNGMLFLNVVDNDPGTETNFHLEVYSDASFSNMVAYSAAYDGEDGISPFIGQLALIATNGSGLGGSITVQSPGTRYADDSITVKTTPENHAIEIRTIFFDQRGDPYIRDAYGGVDIGAYERWHLPTGTILIVK